MIHLKEEVVDGKSIRRYDKHCLHLSKEEVEANLAKGMPYVIRLNVPEEGETSFEDELYGTITVPNKELDDMILIKSDGYPTYNFANVVDDHLMGIYQRQSAHDKGRGAYGISFQTAADR